MFPFEETVTNFKGFNMTDLELDEAWLNISSSFSVPVWLYILSDDCDSVSNWVIKAHFNSLTNAVSIY